MRSVTEFLPYLAQGALITIQISAIAIALASVVGMVLAGMRMSSSRILRIPATWYVNIFRSTPLLVQFLWVYFALPVLVGVHLSAFLASVLALGLYTAAFAAEIFRAGILSVEQLQREAALALGMDWRLSHSRVILPQAIHRMLPALTTCFVTLVKDSSLASVLAISELTRRGQEVVQQTLSPVEVFTVVGVLYLLINLPLMWASEALYRRRQYDDVRSVRA